MKNTRLMTMFAIAAILLLVPLIAMQFTAEVAWDSADFTIAGILLFGTALTCELILRFVRNARDRFVFVGIALAALILIWLELAVGIFGTAIAGS